MTVVEIGSHRAHVCRTCGALVIDRVSHERWHDAIDEAINSLEHVRNILLGLEEDVHHLSELER